MDSTIRLEETLNNFTRWLDGFGETSFDHQSFFAGKLGGRAKSLYYKNKMVGLPAVAPMIFFEAFLPSARKLFHKKMRFPIADAHYAMGFAHLFQATGDSLYFDRAVHFLDALKRSRCPDFEEYCWGYPFDWVTRSCTIHENTPFITSTPYMYEAFSLMLEIEPRDDWKTVLESIARHVANDIKDFPTSERGSTCSYSPSDNGGVINAASYRAGMLARASKELADENLWKIAERNAYYVLENQNEDGSWYYATDGVRDFVDHFHTCFVMKGLAKVYQYTGHQDTRNALEKGVRYYLENLYDEDGLPKPFSKAPRMTVYKRELYDCAEAINLCLLLRDRFPEMQKPLDSITGNILDNWIQKSGAFRARRLHLSWDNVPMHRWGQSQMFRSLALHLKEDREQSSEAASSSRKAVGA